MAATMNLPIADSLSLHQTHRSQEPADLGTDAAKHFHSHSRSSDVHRQPGDPGSFEAIERRGGSEDPWLCAPDFRQVCFCRTINDPPIGDSVNSENYANRDALSVLAKPALALMMGRWEGPVRVTSGKYTVAIDTVCFGRIPAGELISSQCLLFKRTAIFRKQPLD